MTLAQRSFFCFDVTSAPASFVAENPEIVAKFLAVTAEANATWNAGGADAEAMLPLIAQEREKHEKRKEIASRYEAYFREGAKLLEDARKRLGDDDPAVQHLKAAVVHCAGAQRGLHEVIERGSCLEDF